MTPLVTGLEPELAANIPSRIRHWQQESPDRDQEPTKCADEIREVSPVRKFAHLPSLLAGGPVEDGQDRRMAPRASTPVNVLIKGTRGVSSCATPDRGCPLVHLRQPSTQRRLCLRERVLFLLRGGSRMGEQRAPALFDLHALLDNPAPRS